MRIARGELTTYLDRKDYVRARAHRPRGTDTKIHPLALDDHRAWGFSRSTGRRHDALEGRQLLWESGLEAPDDYGLRL